jgi:hypothetical protein
MGSYPSVAARVMRGRLWVTRASGNRSVLIRYWSGHLIVTDRTSVIHNAMETFQAGAAIDAMRFMTDRALSYPHYTYPSWPLAMTYTQYNPFLAPPLPLLSLSTQHTLISSHHPLSIHISTSFSVANTIPSPSSTSIFSSPLVFKSLFQALICFCVAFRKVRIVGFALRKAVKSSKTMASYMRIFSCQEGVAGLVVGGRERTRAVMRVKRVGLMLAKRRWDSGMRRTGTRSSAL